MRPNAKRLFAAGTLLLVVATLLSGCIVCVDDPHCGDYPPKMATLYVYALDYYTGHPIHWAQVELYEFDWWNWEYLGTWSVNDAGYARLRCGYLYYDGHGGEEEDYRVVVYAAGYCPEAYDIGLSYYYPRETLTFYLVPCGARASVDGEGESSIEAGESDGTVGPDVESSGGRVVVGGDGEEAADGEGGNAESGREVEGTEIRREAEAAGSEAEAAE